jgi:sulfite reductase alpha subunit-like flavoprotein
MICAGTGISPFRSFWSERYYQMQYYPYDSYGEFILFFGLRDIQKDFVYKNEIVEMINKKVITSLFTTISRDPANKEKVKKFNIYY